MKTHMLLEAKSSKPHPQEILKTIFAASYNRITREFNKRTVYKVIIFPNYPGRLSRDHLATPKNQVMVLFMKT